jgi:hypothetical protein
MVEIMFSDLIEEKQKEILELYGMSSEEEGNFEIIPLAVLECYSEENEPLKLSGRMVSIPLNEE